jgi:hypothetical protein
MHGDRARASLKECDNSLCHIAYSVILLVRKTGSRGTRHALCRKQKKKKRSSTQQVVGVARLVPHTKLTELLLVYSLKHVTTKYWV